MAKKKATTKKTTKSSNKTTKKNSPQKDMPKVRLLTLHGITQTGNLEFAQTQESVRVQFPTPVQRATAIVVYKHTHIRTTSESTEMLEKIYAGVVPKGTADVDLQWLRLPLGTLVVMVYDLVDGLQATHLVTEGKTFRGTWFSSDQQGSDVVVPYQMSFQSKQSMQKVIDTSQPLFRSHEMPKQYINQDVPVAPKANITPVVPIIECIQAPGVSFFGCFPLKELLRAIEEETLVFVPAIAPQEEPANVPDFLLADSSDLFLTDPEQQDESQNTFLKRSREESEYVDERPAKKLKITDDPLPMVDDNDIEQFLPNEDGMDSEKIISDHLHRFFDEQNGCHMDIFGSALFGSMFDKDNDNDINIDNIYGEDNLAQ